MSDFGLFENDEATQAQPRLAAKTAARQMEAAIDVVRSKFGRFLMGATGIDEFGDRWHLSKHDIRSTVEPYVFPNTGTMRRLHNAMKQDWKLAHPYKLAEDRDAPFQDLDETYHPSNTNLIPEGDFERYKDSVDQGGPAKVESNDFTPGGDSGRHEAARLVADIYTDFARSNGLRVASLETLEHYAATGIHEDDYRLLESMIVRTAEAEDDCECDDDDESEESGPPESDTEDGGDDGDSDSAPPQDDDSEDDDSGEDDTVGDEEEPAGGGDGPVDDGGDDDFPGGDQDDQTFTVPDQAPELDPRLQQEIPQDDQGGSAPVPPEVIDSILGLPEGTIEQLLLEEVEQASGAPGGTPQGPPPGAGGPPQDPRMARRRQAIQTWPSDGAYQRHLEDERDAERARNAPPVAPPRFSDEDVAYLKGLGQNPDQAGGGFPDWESYDRYHNAARRFWAAEGDQEQQGGADQGQQQQAPPADPSQGGQGVPPQGDPSMMGGGDPSAMGGGAPAPQQAPPAAPAEDQPAEDQLLDMASNAVQQMIERETQEYQQIVDPLTQALQAIQFAQQIEQAEHPLDVTPPEGSVDVSPAAAPGGAQNPMQPTASRRTAIWGDDEWTEDYDGGFQGAVGPHGWAGHGPAEGQWGWELRTPENEYGRSRAGYGVTNDPEKAKAKARAAWEEWQGRTSSQRQAIFQTFPNQESYQRHLEDEAYAEKARNAPPVAPPRFSDEDVEYLKGLGQTPDQAGGGFPDWESYDRYHNASRRRQAKINSTLCDAAAVIANRYRLSGDGYRMLVAAALSGKGYSDVANALKVAPPRIRSAAAQHVSHLLAAGNPQFRREAFLKTVLAGDLVQGPLERGWENMDQRPGAEDMYRLKYMNDPRQHGGPEGAEWSQDYRDAEQKWLDSYRAEYPTPESDGDFADGHDDEDGFRTGSLSRREHWGRRSFGSRHPFDRTRRTAGETWINTPIQDTFEFENDKPRVSDNIAVSDLPKMPGGHIGRRLESKGGVMERFQRWQQKQQERGLNFGDGDIAAEGFVSEKNVGPGGAAKLHRELGISHPPGDNAVKSNPKPSVPKAKNPVTKRGSWGEWEPTKEASFFTRRVPDWKWDDHLSGYISKEGKAFTCSCGQKVAAPSYKTCSCGKVWNITALGSTQHLASDTADFYVAREIPVRPGVILAGKNMVGGSPLSQAKPTQRELVAMIDKLADWTKYDDEDPARQGGPKKPPSTSIPKQPKDWAKRDSNGTWQGPAIPRKKK